VIDPCCGSGHIAVYLFDVLMQIYETQGWTQREAAQSIVEHNLYTLDIDDRAAQLAYFAVMMKARQYDRRFFTRGLQPHVYAIPEWDEETRKGWSMDLKNLCNLLRDGKEYGSIIEMPEMSWASLRMEVERLDDSTGQLSIDSITEETRQKLCGLIDVGEVMAQKYDVIVTNPPYLGNKRFNAALDRYTKEYYADVKSDLSMVMYKHALCDMVKTHGMVSFITTSSWMFNSSFDQMREYISDRTHYINLIDFGTELFDGKVGHNAIVSWVIQNGYLTDYQMTAIRLVDYCYSRKDEKEPEFFALRNRYCTQQKQFKNIPGSPIAYWVSKEFIKAFESDNLYKYAPTKQGIATADNNRFLRLWFEVATSSIARGILSHTQSKNSDAKWYPYNKGGSFRRWYGNRDYLLNWQHDGAELRSFEKAVIRNPSNYFYPGCTWSDITLSGFSARFSEEGFINDSTGPMCFPSEDRQIYTLCLMNSKPVQAFLNLLAPTFHYREGPVGQIPYRYEQHDHVERKGTEAIHLSKKDWDSFETSWDFQAHPLLPRLPLGSETMFIDDAGRLGSLSIGSIDLSEEYNRWQQECEDRFQQLKANEEELNRIFIDIYGLQDELTPEVEDKDVTVRRADLGRDIRSLISYAVGCMFGRYSLDRPGLQFAGGDWKEWLLSQQSTVNRQQTDSAASPQLTKAVDCRLSTADFSPVSDNCLPITDEDYGLKDDVVNRFVEFIRVVYGDASLETNLDFIAHALGNKGDTSRDVIRNYFLNDFFKDHCQTYSVTGSGKRPIYWLFDSGKANGFKALVYMHRWTADTVGNLRVEYLHRMQRVYEKEIERMQDTIDNARDSREVARATKRREKLVKQLKEARDYDAKIAHVALSRVTIDLDDGVKVNYEKVQKGPDGKSLGILAKI